MKTLTGSAVLLAALFISGVQADDNGLSLEQQRERIGDEMVRERTGNPPADAGTGTGSQPATNQNQQPSTQPSQQSPRSTLNSPARQNRTDDPASNSSGVPTSPNSTPGVPIGGGQSNPAPQGGMGSPGSTGTGGNGGGSAAGGASN